MTDASLAVNAEDGGAREKETTGPDDPGDGTAHRSSHGSSVHEVDKDHEPEPLPLHEKLLEIAQTPQPTNAATLAEFKDLLVEKASEINTLGETGKTALHIAIEQGLTTEAQYIIHGGANIAVADNEGQQPLYLACVEGHTELVELLLSKKASIDAASNRGETPIAAACRNGHTKIVNILLGGKANTKISDNRKWTPLHWASVGNHEEIVKRLLGVDTLNLNATEALAHWTPLNVAAYCGHKGVVSLLLEKNADLYIKNSLQWTPLMTATTMQHLEIVRTILDHKTGWKAGYLERGNHLNNNPLHVASKTGFYEIASLLIGAGANCNATDSQGMTPLHVASFHNHSKIVALLLSEAPVPVVDVNAEADDGRTSLHLASLQGNELIVKALLQKNASIDATDKTGMTPLHLASGANAEDRCLSDPDPVSPSPSGDDDPDSENGNTEAKSGRHLSVVELLLLNGANKNIKDTNGDTALHRAAALGDKTRINVLRKEMKADDFSWGDWKDSPVYSALVGSNPGTAVESLLAKQEVKKAPFWKGGGRIQVITEAAKNSKPYDILHSLFRELSRDSDSSPEGCKSWGPIQWAAHERLPDVLSGLINKSGSVENVDHMVHEALQITSGSIGSDELQSEPSCESLVQVKWILITNSERTPKNTKSVRAASELIRSIIEQKAMVTEVMEDLYKLWGRVRKLSDLMTDYQKKFNLIKENERLSDGQETCQLDPGDIIRNFEGHAMKDMEPRTSKNVKVIAILSTLQDILKDPPFAQIAQTHKDEVDYSPPVPGPDHQKIVKKAEATVVGFFKGKGESGRIRRNRPIQEIVYDPGPTDVMGTAITNLTDITRRGSMSFNSKLYAKENLKLTWVHLPSTNMIWMNDLLTSIMSHEGYRTREYYEVRSFFRDSWVEVPDKESRSRMMRPRSVTRPKENRVDPKPEESEISESSKDIETEDSNLDREGEGGGAREKNEKDTKKGQATTADSQQDQQKVYADWKSNTRQPVKKSHGFVNASAIYMPYLAYSTHCRHWDNRLVPDNQELKDAHDLYEELQDKYEGKDKQQHGSPTLDEWYYQFAQGDNEARDDQNSRNESQVVSKYLKENPETNDTPCVTEPNQWTVVRVNQLWIWTISKDWIITATSSPFDNSPDALVEDILNQLSKQAEYGGSHALPVSATELVPIIIDHCIGSYEKKPNESNRISIGQTFSHYINSIGRQETTLFDSFRAWSLEEHPRKKEKATANKSPMIQSLVKSSIKDTAGTTPSTSRVGGAETKQTNVQTQSQIISAAIKEEKRLYGDIKDVRDELNILKSVAQFQQIVQRGLAGKEVDESWFSSTYVVKDLQELDSIAERIQSAISTTLSLQQSDVANRQATEATRQGKTVMTFTFATVLFLPLSFLSSLFALDVASFQEAPAWAFYVIFFVSIGISAILGFSVFYWDNIKRAKGMLFEIIEKSFESDSSPTSRPSKLPEKKGTGGSDTAVSIPLKMKDGERGLKRLFKRHGRGADIHDIAERADTPRN
ncbi:hypothetical protein FOYG_13970 [Fusarium oxysporum NRRL 32931]|uniref:Uncharacterized protein n=1 Tax=Fusarium oxysporum NRRL 32931 TaxID=660029 RepID=W9HPH1_FUSOX|nr:hypothetical protein FOYG_13970 [Fusarium oxysporum NRRL 32931]